MKIPMLLFVIVDTRLIVDAHDAFKTAKIRLSSFDYFICRDKAPFLKGCLASIARAYIILRKAGRSNR